MAQDAAYNVISKEFPEFALQHTISYRHSLFIIKYDAKKPEKILLFLNQ